MEGVPAASTINFLLLPEELIVEVLFFLEFEEVKRLGAAGPLWRDAVTRWGESVRCVRFVPFVVQTFEFLEGIDDLLWRFSLRFPDSDLKLACQSGRHLPGSDSTVMVKVPGYCMHLQDLVEALGFFPALQTVCIDKMFVANHVVVQMLNWASRTGLSGFSLHLRNARNSEWNLGAWKSKSLTHFDANWETRCMAEVVKRCPNLKSLAVSAASSASSYRSLPNAPQLLPIGVDFFSALGERGIAWGSLPTSSSRAAAVLSFRMPIATSGVPARTQPRQPTCPPPVREWPKASPLKKSRVGEVTPQIQAVQVPCNAAGDTVQMCRNASVLVVSAVDGVNEILEIPDGVHLDCTAVVFHNLMWDTRRFSKFVAKCPNVVDVIFSSRHYTGWCKKDRTTVAAISQRFSRRKLRICLLHDARDIRPSRVRHIRVANARVLTCMGAQH